MRLRLLVTMTIAGAIAGCGSSGPSGQRTQVNPNAPEVNPAGDIPDNQVYVPFAVPGQRLTLKVPEGWSRRAAAGGAVTFTDKLNSITVRVVPASAPPAAGSVPVPAGGHVATLTRPAGRVVKVSYLAKSPPDPVTGKTRLDAVERYLFF